ARRGLPDGLCENSHHRKTSTLTPTPTRRPRSHHSYTLICEEPAIAPLAAAIRAHRAEDRVCVASFSPRRLAGFRALMGDRVATSVSVGAVAWSAYVPWLPRVLNSGAQVFQIPTSQAFGAVGIPVLTRNLARVAASRAMRIHVWTIDQSDEMVQLMDSGVDGIVSNRIDVLRRVARERALW
ncbi:hypothetical protein FAM23852_001322, partial [Propionibacterium freudenreichii]|uniref:glycerophosphodiester phosphodiesterase family protein n=1 Tax=Propionibacterium freudenreichii TaxID=1744 RepID=UPI00254A74D1